MSTTVSPKREDTSFGGVVVAVILAILFSAAGFAEFLKYVQQGRWEMVQATISQVQFHGRQGPDGENVWHVTGTYTFQLAGKAYQGNRLVSDEPPSAEEDFWRNLYMSLDRARQKGTPITVLVNPEDPSASVVTRRLYPSMVMVPACALYALWCAVLMIKAWLHGVRMTDLKNSQPTRYPSQPWHGDELGSTFRLNSGAWQKTLEYCLAAIVWSGCIAFYIHALRQCPHSPLVAKLAVGILGFAVAVFDFKAVFRLFRYRRFGDPTLLLAEWPIAIGKPFAGAIMTSSRYGLQTRGVKFVLRCLKKTTTESGNQQKVEIEELFSTTAHVKKDSELMGTAAIRFKLDLPGGLPSREPDMNPEIEWKLEVTTEAPGIAFEADFILPVYQVDDPKHLRKMGTK